MTRRNHLMLDAIGQAGIILYFAFLLTKTTETIVLLQLFAISLAAWQFVNGVLSYKFFEGQSKKQYVRIAGIAWICIFGLLGLLFFFINFMFISGNASVGTSFISVFERVESAIWIAFPAVLSVFVFWYLYITIQDINVVINKTI